MQVGRDAAICALMAGRPEVLRVLLERGASTVAVNYVGQRVAVALTKSLQQQHEAHWAGLANPLRFWHRGGCSPAQGQFQQILGRLWLIADAVWWRLQWLLVTLEVPVGASERRAHSALVPT